MALQWIPPTSQPAGGMAGRTGPSANQSPGMWVNPDAQTANISGQYGVQESQIGADASRFGATTAANASMANTQTSAQASRDVAAQQAAAQRDAAGQQAQLGYYQSGVQQNQFGQVYSSLSQQMNNPQNWGGAPATTQPGITTGPIWTPSQVNQQVNQSNAQQIQGAQGQQRQAANTMAGQGFGSRSPALAQIQANAMSQAIANAASNAGNIRYQAAQGNAGQQLASEAQAQTGWNQAQQQDVQRRALNEQYQASLAQAMAGLV